MSHYKNHKKRVIKILSALSKHMQTSSFDYEIVDLERALEEATRHYKHYLDMKDNEKYKPEFENKTYK